LAYRSVDIPTSKIFTIDYRGHLRLELLIGYRSSYVSLNDMVDHVFPPLKDDFPHPHSVTIRISEYYSDFNYWKQPLPDIPYDVFPEFNSHDEEQEPDEDDDFRFTGYPYV
jgi:phosphatidate phosphatase LPIN